MGDALRETIEKSRQPDFRDSMKSVYGIHPNKPIFDHEDDALVRKARSYPDLIQRFGDNPSERDWLEYCVTDGLLVPDRWSEHIIEGTIADRAAQAESIVILDGYPRTEIAAQHVLDLTERIDLPIIKVVHLSVSKNEMHRRALGRKREDDEPEMLERRYQFYVDHVQPCVELLKATLGSRKIALIDAHQPAYHPDGSLNLEASVRNVANRVLMSLGVSRHILANLAEGHGNESSPA